MSSYRSHSAAINKRFLQAKNSIVGERGITDKEFCPSVGIKNPSMLSMLGKTPPSTYVTLDHVFLISKNYGISLEWLFFGKGDMKSKPDKGIRAQLDQINDKLDNAVDKMIDALIIVGPGAKHLSAGDFLKKINKS
jgi:hypothetical protein